MKTTIIQSARRPEHPPFRMAAGLPVAALCAALLLLPDRPGFSQQVPDAQPGNPDFLLFIRPSKGSALVTNEDGSPIEGAEVSLRFDNAAQFSCGYDEHKGKSGPDGKFTAEGRSGGSFHVRAQKEGYYSSLSEHFEFNDEIGDIEVLGSYDAYMARARELVSLPHQPWNPTLPIVLRRVGNPIPLYFRDVEGDLPWSPEVLDKDIGWDLFKGAWLPPYGKGAKADLLFRFTLTDAGPRKLLEYTMRLANPDDGLIPIPAETIRFPESALIFPREALVDGYDLKSLAGEPFYEDGTDPPAPDQPQVAHPIGYFARIRTAKGKDGAVASAHYAILESRSINPSKKSADQLPEAFLTHLKDAPNKLSLALAYRLNPTPNDRNLEFDEHRNLAGR